MRRSTTVGWSMALSLLSAAAVAADDAMVSAGDLLKDSRFKSAYAAALGPKAKERWLATMSNSALVRKVTVAGSDYQLASPCKPHDCADNNLLLLWGAGKGVVYGRLYEKGRVTLLGSPDAAMAAELERLWKKEFRQQ